MAKHMLMQATVRDPRTKQILYRQRPRTFPPDIGMRLLNTQPLDWEVVDMNKEVPDDPRYHYGRKREPGMKEIPEGELSAKTKKA